MFLKVDSNIVDNKSSALQLILEIIHIRPSRPYLVYGIPELIFVLIQSCI